MATRRERVILDLEDNLSGGLAKAAVASRLLKTELNDLGRDSTRAGKGLDETGTSATRMGRNTRAAGADIDRFSGRLRLLLDTVVLLGPALVPLGAATIPVLSGAIAGLGVAGAGLGVTILALNGVGDALSALNDYQLERTPENLAKVSEEFRKMGPSGAHFVRFLDSIEPELKSLQLAARDGLLPGVEDGISELLTNLPQIRDLVSQISQAMGGLAADAGADLAGPEWEAFFEYLRTDAAPTLEQFGRTVGNFAQGFANLLVGLAPATRDFGSGLEDLSLRFADWAATLDDNRSFQEFVDYVRQSGPQAAEMLGALAKALAGIAQAMAPYGSVVLPVLTQVANMLGAIASTNAGAALVAAAAGLVAFNRAAKLSAASMTRLSATLAANPWGLAAAALTLAVVEVVSADDKLVAATERAQDALNSGDTEWMRSELIALQNELDATALKMYPDTPGSFSGAIRDGIPILTAFGDGVAQASDLWSRFSGAHEEAEDKVRDLEDALKGEGTALTSARNAISRYAGAALEAAAASEEEAAAINEAREAMREKRQEAIRAFDAETRYAEAVKEATRQSKRNSAGINENTAAGRNNRNALSQLASGWNDLDDSVNNNVYAFREARRNFIDTAVAMGVPRQAARELARELLDIPEKVDVKVDVPTDHAMSGIRAIEAGLRGIPDETVRVNVVRTGTGINAAEQGVGANPNKPPERRASGRSFGRGSVSADVPFAMGRGGDGYDVGARKAEMFGEILRGAAKEGNNVTLSLHWLRRSLNEAERAVERERRQRDALVSRREAARSAIVNDLQSDLFGVSQASGNVWDANATPGGVMDPQAAAEARRDRAQRWVAALRALKSMGVRPAAMQAIISEGLEAAEFMAAQSQAYISTFSSTLDEAAQYTAQAGNIAANAVVSVAEMNAANAELREANQELKRIRKAVERADKNNKDGHKGTQQANADFQSSVRKGHRRGKAYAG